MIEFDMNLVRYYREHHGVNQFMRSSKIDTMGGLPRRRTTTASTRSTTPRR